MSFLLFFAYLAFAEEPDFEIMVDPTVYSESAFAGEGRRTHKMPLEPSRGQIPNRETREAAFARVPNLDLSGFDELDRDRLYVLAQTVSFADLQKSFPKLPKNSLRALYSQLNE